MLFAGEPCIVHLDQGSGAGATQAYSTIPEVQTLSDTGYQYTFTVFTPTFNRACTLHRVYESLSAQTYRDFEWLVVDDGSSDDTRKLIDTWERQARFPLRYIYQPNQGKHVAFNRGVREARGELFAQMLGQVAESSERAIQILEQRGQAPDHPVSASCLETEYLKCFICHVG